MFKSFHFNRMDAEGTFPNGTDQDKHEELNDLFSRVCEELYGNQLENLSRSKLFGCLFCDFCPKTKQDLKTHINTIHKKHLCIICGKLFGKKEFFTLHLKIHEKSQKSLKKKIDGQIMKSSTNTTLKKKSQKKIKCLSCEKLYSNKAAMERHYRFVHKGIKDKYDCQLCEYQATASNALQIHLKSIHEGLRYPCNQCDYQATQESNLRTHIKVKHEGIQFVCNLCEKQFKTPQDVSMHKRSHNKLE